MSVANQNKKCKGGKKIIPAIRLERLYPAKKWGPKKPAMGWGTPRVRPPGFLALRKTDLPRYTALRWMIHRFIDRRDWAEKTPDGIRRRNTKHRLQQPAHRGFVHTLALADLEEHCCNRRTIYVCSRAASAHMLLCVDIDNHDGKATADQLRKAMGLANRIIGKKHVYWEPSTSGTGWHGYFQLHAGKAGDEHVSDVLKVLAGFLVEKARRARLKCGMEIKGQAPRLEKGILVRCGQLVKFPRLTDGDRMDRLLRCPYLPFKALAVAVEKQAEKLLTKPQKSHQKSHVKKSTKNLRKSLKNKDLSTTEASNTPRACPQSIRRCMAVRGPAALSRLSPALRGRLEDLSPALRMSRLGTELSRLLGRPAGEEEIWAAYHDLGLHTGEDEDGNRLKLCQDSARWLAANFRAPSPVKLQKGAPVFLQWEARYVDCLKKQAIPVTRAATIALWVVHTAEFKRKGHRVFDVPVAAVVGAMMAMGERMPQTPRARRRKASGLLQTLCRAGLIACKDPTYEYHFAHYSRKYELSGVSRELLGLQDAPRLVYFVRPVCPWAVSMATSLVGPSYRFLRLPVIFPPFYDLGPPPPCYSL